MAHDDVGEHAAAEATFRRLIASAPPEHPDRVASEARVERLEAAARSGRIAP